LPETVSAAQPAASFPQSSSMLMAPLVSDEHKLLHKPNYRLTGRVGSRKLGERTKILVLFSDGRFAYTPSVAR
jgi:hypothetical protein